MTASNKQSRATTVDQMTIKSSATRALLDGSITITRDKQGMQTADAFRKALETIISNLSPAASSTDHLMNIDAFQNATEVITLGDFTCENRTDQIAFFGKMVVAKKADQSAIRTLHQVVLTAIARLGAETEAGTLPEKIVPNKTDTVDNPFS